MKFTFFIITLALSVNVWAEQASKEMPATVESEVAPATETEPSAQATGETGATNETSDNSVTAAESQPMEEQAGFSRGSVIRSVFTSGIQDREPVDKLSDTEGKTNRLFYFTELRDMSGQTATHRWEYDGKVMGEVKFNVRGPRWRVWSSKNFTPGWAGEWKVSVLNGAGEVINEDMIRYTEPTLPAATDTTPATAPESNQTEPASEQFEPPVNPEMIQ